MNFYRLLLKLYPAGFRDEYAQEMEWALAQRLRSEPAWAVWPSTIFDTLKTASKEQLDTLGRDLRYATRTLARTPGFTAVTVLALALGMGANTAVYSIVRHVLWQPLPYHAPERLAVVLQGGNSPVAPANFLDIQNQTRAFQQLAAAEVWGPTWASAEHPERVPALRVTANLFQLLGVTPLLGRTFSETETRAVVVSHDFWQRQFAGSGDIIGREMVLAGTTYTVIGVMRPGFVFSPFWAKGDVWANLELATRRQDRVGSSLRLFGRLHPGISPQQAQAELTTLSQRLAQAYPAPNNGLALQLVGLQEKVTGNVRPLLTTLLAAVGLVLLVACVNTGSLLLARATQRRREISIRVALGGSAAALTRQLLTESLLLASTAGAAGLLLAQWLVAAVAAMPLLRLPSLESISLDAGVLAFTAALTLATGILFGLAPAWLLKRSFALNSRGVSDATRTGRLRAAFVTAEVTLALILVIGAGLLVRSFSKLAAVDPGFQANGVLTLQVSTTAAPAWRANRGPLYDQLQQRLATLPGVESVSAINHLPLAGDRWGSSITLEGVNEGEQANAVYRVSEPGYLKTMGIPLQAGRDFTPRDDASSPGVVLVNSRFAQRHHVGPGQRISLTRRDQPPAWLTVIGITGDVKQTSWSDPVDPEVYVPLRQSPEFLSDPAGHFSSMTLVLRAKGDPAALASPVRQAVWAVDKNLSISEVLTLEQAADQQLWRPRLAGTLVSGFGLLAMLLAAMGIYGVVAYDASRRTHEIGIRLALGAKAETVIRMVLASGLKMVLPGIALGTLAALALSRWMSSVLFGISPHDEAVFTAVALLFIAIGLAASWLPAWRAARIDPVRALRTE